MIEIPISYHNLTWNLTEKALQPAINLSITLYDAIYLVFSKINNATAVTADQHLYNPAKKKSNIVFITDYNNIKLQHD